MALHEITVHENTGASKETAPYLGSYAEKDTVKLDGFAEAVARECGLPAIQAMAILTGSFDAMEDLERESLVRIHTDIGMVCGVIAGSFPTADAVFDPEHNALNLALYLDDAIRLSLANITPAIVLEGDVTRVRVDNVADIEHPRPYNLIHGRHVFRVAGHKLILSDAGASAYLTNAQGTVFPLVIDQVESDQLFRAHTETALEPGDYRLVVASRGGDAAGDLQRPFRKVKYLRVEDPVPTIAYGYSVGHEGETGKLYYGADFVLKGTCLADSGNDVEVNHGDDVPSRGIGSEYITETADGITIAWEALSPMLIDAESGVPVKFTFANDSGSATLVVAFVNN